MTATTPVVHVGTVGYYTAILAELVGFAARVTAIEFDAEFAARARANFAQTPRVGVVHGDGTRVDVEPLTSSMSMPARRGPRIHYWSG